MKASIWDHNISSKSGVKDRIFWSSAASWRTIHRSEMTPGTTTTSSCCQPAKEQRERPGVLQNTLSSLSCAVVAGCKKQVVASCPSGVKETMWGNCLKKLVFCLSDIPPPWLITHWSSSCFPVASQYQGHACLLWVSSRAAKPDAGLSPRSLRRKHG